MARFALRIWPRCGAPCLGVKNQYPGSAIGLAVHRRGPKPLRYGGLCRYTRADGSAIVNPSVPMGTAIYGIYGTIPPKTVYGMGQALSRATYPGYLAAVTRAQTGTLTAGNNTITSVGNTVGLGAGMPLEGTGIPAGATIASVTSSTIVMSTTATGNGAQTVTAFLPGYGIGGDSTTVGVMDCRGKVIAGRDPSSTNLSGATALNSSQGTSTTTLNILNLPPHTHSGRTGDDSPDHTHSFPGSSSPSVQSGAPTIQSVQLGPVGFNTGGASTRHQHNFTTDNGPGTSTPFSTVQPTVIAECVVVVLP
jgi:microcystin-dependent protein